MANKPKETSAENPNSSTSPSSDDIFKSPSGGIRLDNTFSVSTFSDSDPFLKKHTGDSRSIPEKLKQVLRLDPLGPQIFDTQVAESSDDNSNKRKRKENLPDTFLSDNSDSEREIKKSKREVGLISENSNLDQVKKKRKRIEIEAESGEGKHGGMDLDLDSESGPIQVKGEKVKIGKKRKYFDIGDELIVTDEGFDDEDKLSRTIFVRNLPLKMKKKELLREFGQFGEIESIRIGSFPLLNDKTPAVIKKQLKNDVDRVNANAYIVFKMVESAQASLSCNMGVEGGNPIQVERACPPRKKLKGEKNPLYDRKRTVYIANLPYHVKDEELYQLFDGIDNLKDSIEAIHVVRDPTEKGIAHVLFKTREAANKAVRKHMLKIRDSELMVSRVINSNPILSKRKEPPSDNDCNTSNKKLSMDVGTSNHGHPG